MAQQIINIGSAPDDGTGDTLRTGGDKINDNFTELYGESLKLKGSTDCSANPNYPAAITGDSYRVSVAGKIGGASGVEVEVGDRYYALADNAGGTQASVGTSWDVLQGNTTGSTIASLDDVGDVNAPTPANGDVLTWDDTPGEWVSAAPTGGSNALDDLTDVAAPTPADGDVLTFDSGSGDWVSAAPAGGGDLDDLGDVNAPTPSDGDVLTFDSGSGDWVASAPSGGGGSVYLMPPGDSSGNDGGAFATLSNAFIPAATFTVDRLIGGFNAANIGDVYTMYIANINSSGVISSTVATAASSFTTVATGDQVQNFDLSSPATLTAGNLYIVALVITGGTGTTANRALTGFATIYDYPLIDRAKMQATWSGKMKRYHYAQNSSSPSSGTPAGTSTANMYYLGVRAQL